MIGKTKSSAFKGHEQWWNNLQMTLKTYSDTALYCVVIQAVILLFLSWLLLPAEGFSLGWRWWVAKLVTPFGINPQFHLLGDVVGARHLISNASVSRIMTGINLKLMTVFSLSFLAWFAWPALMGVWKKKAIDLTAPEHIRGMQLIPADQLRTELKNKPGLLPIGPVCLPKMYEPEHVFIAGKTRVGKTVAIMQMINSLRGGNK